MFFAPGFDGGAAGEDEGGDRQQEGENCRGPEGNDDSSRADDPVIFENPEAESAVARGVAWKSGVGIGGGKVIEIPAGFGRMAGLAVGGPGAGVVDEFSMAAVEAALKVIPFAGVILTRCVEGEGVGDAVAPYPKQRAEKEGDQKQSRHDVEYKPHRSVSFSSVAPSSRTKMLVPVSG